VICKLSRKENYIPNKEIGAKDQPATAINDIRCGVSKNGYPRGSLPRRTNASGTYTPPKNSHRVQDMILFLEMHEPNSGNG